MAKEETKTVKPESKFVEGFKFGFGFYVAFLAGSVIVGIISALIWTLLIK